MKKHLILATYDGIGTYYSGVGTIAKNIITALTSIVDKSQLKVSIAYINVDKGSKVYNAECFESARNLAAKSGGMMLPLCNSTKGQTEWDMWSGFSEWNFACVSLVSILNLVLESHEENIIILNDTPFLFFARYRHLVDDANLKCIYFPLSTGKNHAFGDIEWRNNRISAEEDCFKMIKEQEKSKVISLGKTFTRRMAEDYNLSFNEEDYLQNGLCFEKYEGFINRKFDNSELKKFGIDISHESKMIFAWGRCSVAKGFKELAKAWAVCCDNLPNHYLILQMPNNSGESEYFNDVTKILKDLPRSIVIDEFNPSIWKTILRNENTDIVCIPSLMDPFPHTAIEAKLFSQKMNYITIISDNDGAVDAFKQDESFYVDPLDTELFAQKILEVANMEHHVREKIINRNVESIEEFNFPRIFEDFLKTNLQ